MLRGCTGVSPFALGYAYARTAPGMQACATGSHLSVQLLDVVRDAVPQPPAATGVQFGRSFSSIGYLSFRRSGDLSTLTIRI